MDGLVRIYAKNSTTNSIRMALLELLPRVCYWPKVAAHDYVTGVRYGH